MALYPNRQHVYQIMRIHPSQLHNGRCYDSDALADIVFANLQAGDVLPVPRPRNKKGWNDGRTEHTRLGSFVKYSETKREWTDDNGKTRKHITVWAHFDVNGQKVKYTNLETRAPIHISIESAISNRNHLLQINIRYRELCGDIETILNRDPAIHYDHELRIYYAKDIE